MVFLLVFANLLQVSYTALILLEKHCTFELLFMESPRRMVVENTECLGNECHV